MRTLTVKEAAQALGVSVRTVQHRLNTGELKGKRTPNQYGVSEWRVWPNKEIMERLSPGKSFDEIDFSAPSEEFLGGDSSAVIDAEAIEGERDNFDGPSLRTIVRELTQQFSEQLSREKSVVAQLQRDLEDKERQLKLLPDFQKQAEEERKAAELKELEAEALRKQIEAMNAVKTESEESQRRAEEEIQLLKVEKEAAAKLLEQENEKLKQTAEESKAAKDAEIKALENRLSEIDEYKRKSEASQRLAEEELKRLRDEKEAQATAVQEQLQALSATVQELTKPKPSWWQKLFGPPAAE